MARELLLLRHGKSDWDTEASDFNRPLKDRGKRGAQRIGVWLQQQELFPDYIVSSPAERAIATAEKTCKAMGQGTQAIHRNQQIYGADLEALREVLGGCSPQARRVLLVGHNPGLEDLLVDLTAGELCDQLDGVLFRTASLARLNMPEEWTALKTGCAKLLSLMHSRSLPRKFPFPGSDSTEFRIRPSYYYNQSSVIPYRLVDGNLEILVIGSSKKKHWVVPKGVGDPGLTPQASAAKEAWEEAGIEGMVNDKAIGVYCYEKWAASCEVKVYPMKVTRVLPETQWEESYRGREWVSPEKAVACLKQPELKPMINTLVRTLQTR